jgi:hypothetical protein
MKKSLLVMALAIALGLLLFFAMGGLAQMGPGMMGQGYGYGYGTGPGMMGRGYQGGYEGQRYCPYCGSYLGSGGGYYGMGSGMMGSGCGYGMGPGMMGPGYQYQLLEKPLQKKDAETKVEDYIQSLHNSDLKLGKVTEKDGSFEAEILGKNKVVVATIIVDKNTGFMHSAMKEQGKGPGAHYGYGMGSGMMGQGRMGPGMMGPGYGPQYQQESKPLAEKDVKTMVENYIKSTRNPNLKVGKVTAKDGFFEAEIVTKKNDVLVDTILVDKNTGWMSSSY